MKNLINKEGVYYLTDDTSIKDGKTRKVSGDYKITKDNMPHIKFKNNIVLYGRYTCPYCIATVDFLKSKPDLFKKTIFVEIRKLILINKHLIYLLKKTNISSI
jgi:protein-disulfide isomerase